MDWILCLIAGALAGSLVSMTGSGAGFLLAPGLGLALSFDAFPNADLFKIAVATTHGANLITVSIRRGPPCRAAKMQVLL